MFSKKIIILLVLQSINLLVNAQSLKFETASEKNSILKINLSALALKNISVQYERKISNRSTISLNAKVMPYGYAPFRAQVEKMINSSKVDLDNFKIGSYGITPEYRFYPGKRGAFHGFYVGPFANINNYKGSMPFVYNNGKRNGVGSGNITSYTLGLQTGAQWQLSKTLYLDWWILGLNYGYAKGSVNISTSFSSSDQSDLKYQLEKNKNTMPMKVKAYEVNESGTTIKGKAPWGGIRAMGVCIGIRF